MRYLICIFILMPLLSGVLLAQPQVIDKVVATIGGELVLLSDVEEQHSLMQAQRGVIPPDARCAILDNILVTKLLLNQAKLDSVEVSDDEVETQLNARIDRILTLMNNDMTQFEAYYGQTISQVKEQFREDLRNQLLVERMRSKVMTGITVTPSEVKKFFDQIPRDSLPYFNSEVEIGEIVYKPQINAEQRKKSVEKLEEIRKRITEGGETFEAMAQKYSDDGSARAGGDLGWSKRGKFVPAFEAASYKLEKDEISPVIETEFGFHIIQMLERRGNSIHVRHILVRPEITEEDIQLARNHLDSVRQLILKDSLSFSVAVKRFSDKNVQSYNNDGRMVNSATGNTFFEVGDLDPDIYFAIDTMKVGGITAPFEFTDPSGDSYFRIILLQSRTVPHRANLKQDYSKIQQAAIQAKQSEFISNWVDEKTGSTYIAVDDLYNNCPNISRWQKEKIKP
ncbi:MAG: peptidylprolyl isomerase [Saprospiraceae bacterium]|nr:peptidylprolyl isomerase [Saprospiraceae bacterium]